MGEYDQSTLFKIIKELIHIKLCTRWHMSCYYVFCVLAYKILLVKLIIKNLSKINIICTIYGINGSKEEPFKTPWALLLSVLQNVL